MLSPAAAWAAAPAGSERSQGQEQEQHGWEEQEQEHQQAEPGRTPGQELQLEQGQELQLEQGQGQEQAVPSPDRVAAEPAELTPPDLPQVGVHARPPALGGAARAALRALLADSWPPAPHPRARACRAQGPAIRRREPGGKVDRKTSRFMGVSWHKGSRKWQARLKARGRSFHLGMHSDEEDAARAHDVMALTMYRRCVKCHRTPVAGPPLHPTGTFVAGARRCPWPRSLLGAGLGARLQRRAAALPLPCSRARLNFPPGVDEAAADGAWQLLALHRECATAAEAAPCASLGLQLLHTVHCTSAAGPS